VYVEYKVTIDVRCSFIMCSYFILLNNALNMLSNICASRQKWQRPLSSRPLAVRQLLTMRPPCTDRSRSFRQNLAR